MHLPVRPTRRIDLHHSTTKLEKVRHRIGKTGTPNWHNRNTTLAGWEHRTGKMRTTHWQKCGIKLTQFMLFVHYYNIHRLHVIFHGALSSTEPQDYALFTNDANAKKITSYDIDRVFNLYDRDKNGTIEDEELQGFLKDLLELAQEDYDDEDMEFFKRVILKEWDVNHDGKISKQELKMILLQQSRLASEEMEAAQEIARKQMP